MSEKAGASGLDSLDTPVEERSQVFFVVLVPAFWLTATMVSWKHPGDGYGLYAVGLVPALWLVPFLEWDHLREVLVHAFVSGAVTMGLVGWVMDLLGLWRMAWVVVWGVAAAGLTMLALSQYPTLERAIAKNGSLTAYVASASNLATFVTCVLFLLVGGYVRLVRGVSRRSWA